MKLLLNWNYAKYFAAILACTYLLTAITNVEFLSHMWYHYLTWFVTLIGSMVSFAFRELDRRTIQLENILTALLQERTKQLKESVDEKE